MLVAFHFMKRRLKIRKNPHRANKGLSMNIGKKPSSVSPDQKVTKEITIKTPKNVSHNKISKKLRKNGVKNILGNSHSAERP